MPVQSPDYTQPWMLGGLPPEDHPEFNRVLVDRLHNLERWIRATHARVNLAQPFILPPVALAANRTLPGGVSDAGFQLSFTAAIRSQALVLLSLDATTSAAGVIGGGISVNGGADILLGPEFNLSASGEVSGTQVYGVTLSAGANYTIKARVNTFAGSWQLIANASRISLIGAPAAYTLP